MAKILYILLPLAAALKPLAAKARAATEIANFPDPAGCVFTGLTQYTHSHMYGTIAIMRALPGRRTELLEIARRQFRVMEHVSGYVGHYLYLFDDDPDGMASSVVFDSKASYMANARSQEQNQRYEEIRALMREDPQWLDGEVESFLRF